MCPKCSTFSSVQIVALQSFAAKNYESYSKSKSTVSWLIKQNWEGKIEKRRKRRGSGEREIEEREEKKEKGEEIGKEEEIEGGRERKI
jgi:hypothetical protein